MTAPNTAPSRDDLPTATLALKQSAGQATRRAYRIPEFCAAYGVSRSQTYVEITAGRLKIRKCGRRTLIATDDAEAWFAACAVAPKAA